MEGRILEDRILLINTVEAVSCDFRKKKLSSPILGKIALSVREETIVE